MCGANTRISRTATRVSLSRSVPDRDGRKSSRRILSVLTGRDSGVKGGGAPTGLPRILNYLPKRVRIYLSFSLSLMLGLRVVPRDFEYPERRNRILVRVRVGATSGTSHGPRRYRKGRESRLLETRNNPREGRRSARTRKTRCGRFSRKHFPLRESGAHTPEKSAYTPRAEVPQRRAPRYAIFRFAS